MVGTRTDGPNHFFRFSGRKDELHVRGWFLYQLQKRVKPLWRDHVGFVQNEHFESVTSRRIHRTFTQITRVVNTVVTSSVNLYNVQRPRPSRGQVTARSALPARSGRGALCAVEAPCEDSGRGGFSATARTRKEVRVVDPPVVEGSFQRTSDMVLADNVSERIGPVAAVKSGRHMYYPNATH